MEDYTKLVTELINDEIKERMDWDKSKTRADVIKELNDNGFENIFGNIDGSRTYSTWEAQQFLEKSGALWDDDIRDLFAEISDEYFAESLARGAETLDVIICELLGSRVLYEIAEAEGMEL